MFSDTFTDSAIGSRLNGDHREKVLQRWDGGDSNGENFDLDADTVSSTSMLVYPIQPQISVVVFLGIISFTCLKLFTCHFMSFSLMAGMPARCSASMRRPME